MSAAAFGAVIVVLFGVAALVGVSAYIDYHRERESTPIEVEAET